MASIRLGRATGAASHAWKDGGGGERRGGGRTAHAAGSRLRPKDLDAPAAARWKDARSAALARIDALPAGTTDQAPVCAGGFSQNNATSVLIAGV